MSQKAVTSQRAVTSQKAVTSHVYVILRRFLYQRAVTSQMDGQRREANFESVRSEKQTQARPPPHFTTYAIYAQPELASMS